MKILGIETSSIVASVAIYEKDVLLGEITINHPRTHAQKLMPIIETLFDQLGLEIKDIDLIGVANGPGSFTGIRIGLATAKALAHRYDIPVVTIGSLEVLACNFISTDAHVASIIDGRRKRIFIQEFQLKNGEIKQLMEPTLTTIDEYLEKHFDHPIIFIGSGVIENLELIEQEKNDNIRLINGRLNLPSAASVCEAAFRRSKKTYLGYQEVQANYLRKSQAERSMES